MESEAKNPSKVGRHRKDCDCDRCKTRRRVKEAITRSARDGGDVQILVPREEILNADLGPILATKHKGRERVVQWLSIKAKNPDLTNGEIAKELGMTPAALGSLLKRAVKGGWLVFEDPISRLEHEIIPKVVDNLSAFLDQKDKQVTIEVAKGTLFKQFQEAKGIHSQPTTILALKIESIAPENVKIVGGKIVGLPKIIDAEVTEVKEEV